MTRMSHDFCLMTSLGWGVPRLRCRGGCRQLGLGLPARDAPVALGVALAAREPGSAGGTRHPAPDLLSYELGDLAVRCASSSLAYRLPAGRSWRLAILETAGRDGGACGSTDARSAVRSGCPGAMAVRTSDRRELECDTSCNRVGYRFDDIPVARQPRGGRPLLLGRCARCRGVEPRSSRLAALRDVPFAPSSTRRRRRDSRGTGLPWESPPALGGQP